MSQPRWLRGLPAKLLSADEERALGAALRAGQDAARHRLVLANLRLVVTIAGRWAPLAPPTLDFEDLAQEGVVGLLDAARRFEPQRGYRFSTYATWWITHRVQQAVQRARRARWLPNHEAPAPRSLPVGTLDGPLAKILPDRGGTPETATLARLRGQRLLAALRSLPAREVTILWRHRVDGETLTQIGRDLGLSRERVRQLEALAIRRLRRRLQRAHP